MVQINIWFIPRTRSTALAKCLSNISDSKVFFENLVWAFYLGDEDRRESVSFSKLILNLVFLCFDGPFRCELFSLSERKIISTLAFQCSSQFNRFWSHSNAISLACHFKRRKNVKLVLRVREKRLFLHFIKVGYFPGRGFTLNPPLISWD